MEERESWRCVSEHDGMKNPLCDNCTSLMSSSGLAKAASPGGFVHSSDLFTPPRYPYLWDVEKFSCPLCKLCFSLRNKSRQLCPQHVPSEGFKIFWDNNTKQLTLRISLDLRFSPRHYVGCSQSLCILADQDERIPPEYGIRSLFRNLAGQGSMSAAKTLLDMCLQRHERCHAGVRDPPSLPTRVLDLKLDAPMHETFCRLVESAKCSRDKYACLSYCWGDRKQRQVLTKSQKQHFMRAIRIGDLGQCIQDAIKVVRMVGIRYLWVDALCIVQDDEEDKAAELSRMKDIFKNATFVLAAASSSSSNQGILEPKNVPDAFICKFPALVDGRPVNMTLHSITNYSAGGKHDQIANLDHPLNTCAWTLQECVLARRLLIFSNFEVFWHCREIVDRPVLPSYFGSPKALIPWDRQKILERFAPLVEPASQWLPVWFTLIDDYMGRKMARRSDCINALQGVIAEVEIETGDKFVFGLSTKYFLWSLLWHVPWLRDPRWLEASEEKCLTLSAPSWSWANQKWPVTMNLCLDFMPGAEVITVREDSSSPGGATAQLCGKMKKAGEATKRGPGVIWMDPRPDEEIDEVEFMESAFLFYLGYSRNLSNSYWLREGMTSGGENLFEFFLVLNQSTAGRFRRIGLYHVSYAGDPRPFPVDWAETTLWVE